MDEDNGFEQFGWELGKFYDRVEKLEEQKEEYTKLVDSYEKGAVSPERMESAIYDIAESINHVEDELRDFEGLYHSVIDGFETNDTEVPENPRGMNQEMGKELLEKGFEIITLTNGSHYSSKAADTELAYQSFVESYGKPDFINENLTRSEQFKDIIKNAKDKFERINEEADQYKSQLLYDTLDTFIADAVLDVKDGYTEAAFEQDIENMKAKEVLENPNDRYIGGFESNDGVRDLDKARKQVREESPRGKAENTGPSEKELKENDERIKQKREEVKNRKDRGIH